MHAYLYFQRIWFSPILSNIIKRAFLYVLATTTALVLSNHLYLYVMLYLVFVRWCVQLPLPPLYVEQIDKSVLSALSVVIISIPFQPARRRKTNNCHDRQKVAGKEWCVRSQSTNTGRWFRRGSRRVLHNDCDNCIQSVLMGAQRSTDWNNVVQLASHQQPEPAMMARKLGQKNDYARIGETENSVDQDSLSFSH